ncbi:MAG: regulatory signaling modulator protein AmpE [Halioglobus sp.]|nr:regulatory signaling modulator protein AmpE [Halioglobus sp.]
MMFLAFVIALILLQVWGSGGPVQRDDWFYAWLSRLSARGLEGAAGLALAVLAPSLLVLWLLHLIEGVLFGLFWIVLATVLLLYAMGRGDFDEFMARYRHFCAAGDFQGGWLAMSAALDLRDAPAPSSPAEAHEVVQRAFFYEACQRWFAVVFYFFLLGPAGALAYRLLHLCRGYFNETPLQSCLFIADWLPGRLLAATFVLAGDFVRSRDILLSGLGEGSRPAATLLFQVGRAALGSTAANADEAAFASAAAAENAATRGLISRSAVAWVALIALVVLID